MGEINFRRTSILLLYEESNVIIELDVVDLTLPEKCSNLCEGGITFHDL